MRHEPTKEELENLGLVLATVNDILAAAYKEAANYFSKSLWAMKSLELMPRTLVKVRDQLEQESFGKEYICDIDVFYPLLSKRGELVFPEGDEDDDT